MPDSDNGNRFPTNVKEALAVKIALLEQMATLAQEQAALAGSLADPAQAAGFDRLAAARRHCMEQIDAIDSCLARARTGDAASTMADSEADPELIVKTKELLERIQKSDDLTRKAMVKVSAGIKAQLADLSARKISLLTYNTNILARKSMIVDKCR